MVTTQTQIRRDTATNLNAATPVAGELGYDTTNERLVIGNGSLAGGVRIPNYKDERNQTFFYATVGGTADAITLTNSPVVGSYTAPLRLKFKATATNTTATTVNVDGLGNKNIYKMASGSLGALSAGDIVSGGIYEIVYDGTQFQLFGIGQPAPVGGFPAKVTGSISGTTSTHTVDFTTYMHYLLIIDNLAGGGGGITGTLEASSNAGASYVTTTALNKYVSTTTIAQDGGPFTTVGTQGFCGVLDIIQYSTSGDMYVTGELTLKDTSRTYFINQKMALTGACDRLRWTFSASVTGSFVFQPLITR